MFFDFVSGQWCSDSNSQRHGRKEFKKQQHNELFGQEEQGFNKKILSQS